MDDKAAMTTIVLTVCAIGYLYALYRWSFRDTSATLKDVEHFLDRLRNSVFVLIEQNNKRAYELEKRIAQLEKHMYKDHPDQ